MCMTNVYQKPESAGGVFGDVKTRDEVLAQIQGNPAVHEEFLKLRQSFKNGLPSSAWVCGVYR